MESFKLTTTEQQFVEAAEPLIHELSADFEKEQAEEWYLECAELLCRLAHDYCMRHAPPDLEGFLDMVTEVFFIRRYWMHELEAAADLFRGGELFEFE